MMKKEKKKYKKPSMKLIKLKQRTTLLSGSDDLPDVITPCFGSDC